MERSEFKERMKQYKKAREENPGLKYWEWKDIPKYDTGTNSVDNDSNTSGIKTVFTTDGSNWRKRPTQEQLDAFYSGNIERQVQLAEQAEQTVTYANPKYTLDEVVISAKDLKKEKQRKQEYNNVLDLGITAAGFVPGLGEVADAVDVANQLRRGNYGEALTSTAAFLLPGVSANLLRKGVKGIKSMLYNTGRFFQPTAYDKLLELYKNTPILNQKGTFEDYLNYTKTIFPESAISDIRYHGGAKGITKFKDTGEKITTVNPGAKNGIYFSPHKKYAENIRKDRARLLNADGTYRPILKSIGLNLMRNKLNKKVLDETELYTVLLNSKKPLYTTGTWTWAIDDKLGKKIKTDGYDAIVNAGTNQRISKMPETIVFDPNNIHILGNESDALNFQKYLDNHNRPQNGYDLRYNPITQTYEKVLELINQTPYYSAMSPEQHFRSTLIDGTNRHKDIWGYKQFSHAVDQGYRKNDTPIIKEFTWPNDAKVAPMIDAKGNIWFNIGEQSKLTNEIVEDNIAKGFDVTKINNVDELGYPSDIAIVHPFVPIDEKVYGVSKKFKYAEGGEVTDEGGWTESYWSRKNREAAHNALDPTMRFSPEALLVNNAATGEEDQYWRAYLGLINNVPAMNKNAHTEWDAQIEAEKKKNGEPLSDFYGTTPNMDLSLQAVADTLSLGKISREYDKYSKTYNDLPSKKTIDALYNQAKMVMDNPGEWQQMYSDKYIIKSTTAEDDGEINPLGMLAHYGMKWVPEQNALYVHDTYNFPWYARWAGKIKERPKEMKIRSKIGFNPKKGSKLLRSAENYNNAYK